MKKPNLATFYFWSLPLLLCLSALGLFGLSIDNRQVEDILTRSLARIDDISKIHVRLNTDVLQSRLFILNHFDSITQDQQEIVARSRELTQDMDRIFGIDSPAALKAHILAQMLNEKKNRIEQFKSSISVYKNSDRYTGVVVRELIDSLRLPQQTGFLTEFFRFHNQLNRFITYPNTAEQGTLLQVLQNLEKSGQTLSKTSQLLIDQYIAHSRMIILNAEKIDSLINLILDQEQDSNLNKVFRDLSAEQTRIRILLGEYSLALYIIIGLLSVYTFVILIKLKISNDSLEVRVKERTQEFHVASEKAIAADAAKTAFLAHMSHEIRTPLNGVIGITASLLRRNLALQERDMVSAIASCGKSLLSLIEDVLDFSKIEAKKLKLDIHSMNLLEVIEESMDIVCMNANAQNVTLLTEIDPMLPANIEGDRNRIGQILLNFLSNAIKFTKNGKVTVKAEANVMADKKVQITLSVIDNGIGISDEQLKNLFKEFSQADESISSKFGGTGLGLVISKKLAELMGGKIIVKSQYGSGSTFSFVFTTTESSERPSSLSDSSGSSGNLGQSHPHNILVVDDNFINRKVAADLLNTLGYTPILAKDGLEALELMAQKSFDIVFTDLRMPGIDGYELVSRILAAGHRGVHFVAMTASATLEEKEKCLRHGIEGFISKPIRVQELIEILSANPNKVE